MTDGTINHSAAKNRGNVDIDETNLGQHIQVFGGILNDVR